MRKLIFCSLFFLLPAILKSQELTQIGIQAGINFNGAKVSNTDFQQKITLGFHAGVQGRYSFSKRFGIKGMLLFEQRGFTYEDVTVEYPPDTIGRADLIFRYNYIDIKILPMLSFGETREIYLYAGPFIGFSTGNKYTTKFRDPVPAGYPSSASNKSENVKPLNFGIALGFGTQVPFTSKIKASFDFRSDIGLSNIFKNGKATLASFSLSPGIVYVF